MLCVKCKINQREYNKYCYSCSIKIIADFKENSFKNSNKYEHIKKRSRDRQNLRIGIGIKKALSTWNDLECVK